MSGVLPRVAARVEVDRQGREVQQPLQDLEVQLAGSITRPGWIARNAVPLSGRQA